MSEYEKQAEKFLADHGLKFRAVQHGGRCPHERETRPFCDGKCIHSDRYRVTISRKGGGRISFDFWNSFNDMRSGKEPTTYDVLAHISGDIYCPDKFTEFCSEYGYEEDSRKAHSTFVRCEKFSQRLRAFFSEEEQEALGEIQ